MPNFFTRKIKPTGRSAHNIIIQGKPVDIGLAKIVYKCIWCLANLKNHNAGLKCSENSNHYGFIHRKEAAQLTEEERYMKIGDMFPGQYLRGIDVHEPIKVKILSVKAEQVRSRETNKNETAYLMYFEGLSKGLILNITMAKEVAIFLGSDDTDHWPGKWVTLYRVTDKFFGKTHIVVRIREPKQGDKTLMTGKEKPLNKLTKGEFVGRAKDQLGLSPDLIGFTLKQAGLVNGKDWQPEKAIAMWDTLASIGVALLGFVQTVLSDIPYYSNEKSVLSFLQERNIIFEPGEDSEMGYYNLLDQHAKSRADVEAMSDDEASQLTLEAQ